MVTQRPNRFFFFSSRRRHTRFDCDWSSDGCSSDLHEGQRRLDGRQRCRRRRVDLLVGEERLLSRKGVADVGLCRPILRLATSAQEGRDGDGKKDGRSEERRVGKEGRAARSVEDLKK